MLIEEFNAFWADVQLIVGNAIEEELDEVRLVQLQVVDIDFSHPVEEHLVES